MERRRLVVVIVVVVTCRWYWDTSTRCVCGYKRECVESRGWIVETIVVFSFDSDNDDKRTAEEEE